MTENVAGEPTDRCAGRSGCSPSSDALLVSILVPLVAFVILWQGFLFLRQNDAPKVVTGAIAIVWGVGGVALDLLGR